MCEESCYSYSETKFSEFVTRLKNLNFKKLPCACALTPST